MSETFKAACVQNRAGTDMEANLAEAAELTRAACAAGAGLVCLPEFFSFLEVDANGLNVGPIAEDEHPALPLFAGLAGELEAWVLLGSLAIRTASGRINNRSYLIDAAGRVVARYDKVHLFDVDLAAGERYRESATVDAGDRAVLATTPWGTMGLTVCYDLRFPGLYRTLAQAGAGYLTVPAAFTKTTGQAHWHILLRARAIETGSFVFAPCQTGRHGKAETYGHSLIVDPWGEVLADGGEETGYITADIDPARIAKARHMIPSLQHDRPYTGP